MAKNMSGSPYQVETLWRMRAVEHDPYFYADIRTKNNSEASEKPKSNSQPKRE